MNKKLLAVLVVALLFVGCTVRGGWPRFLRKGETWGWSGPKPDKPASAIPSLSPLAEMAQKRDGTNYIGVYLGMIAEHDGKGGVFMYSATSGQGLKYISYKDFNDIFVLKNRPEYSR